MSLFNFTRPAKDVAICYKDDAALLKTQARLAELQTIIKEASGRLRDYHDNLVAAADAAVVRAENEVLAGVGSEAALAEKQAALIAAKRNRAVDIIAVENAEAEQAQLKSKLPEIEYRAKRVAQKSLRAKYLAAARELAKALEQVRDADARLTAISADALSQFPYRSDVPADRSLPTVAGCGEVGRTTYNHAAHLLQYQKAGGQANDWLAQVNDAIAQTEKLAAELDK